MIKIIWAYKYIVYKNIINYNYTDEQVEALMREQPNRTIIMRGVPGSGKSSAARWIANPTKQLVCWIDECVTYFGSPVEYGSEEYLSGKTFLKDGIYYLIHSAIHSTDEYFMVNGEYKFNQSKIGRNHSKNYKAFRQSIDHEIPLVIVDNTNTTRREWAKYENYAKPEGYWVSYHVMPHPTISEAKERNQHDVPGEVIKKMIQRFE